MAELRPYPFGALVTRMFRELDERQSVFDLPLRKVYRGDPQRDLSARFQGHHPSTPLGPAAGPHTQMAQNIVLAFLGGCRVMELKTVQIMDELDIPRPCIDMETVGYNVEWSQELKLEESLDEYVKASMLIEMLVASGKLDLAPGYERVVFDMSVGYDLKGIQTDRVQAFIAGMRDAGTVVDRLRKQIPREFAQFRDLDFATKLSDTLTLSTFHGCPPEEIELIMRHLLADLGLHAIVKLNPMLLGPARCRGLLNDTLGYTEAQVPDTAFENDAKWPQVQAFCERLGDLAAERGLGFGVKFSNTLIVRNHRDMFPASEKEMYLSGPPLHVLAMNLVGQFRATFGDRWPISFSAGIDKQNFPDAVALGLVPVTTCSDLLKAGGYGRAPAYLSNLSKAMNACGASTLDEYVLRAYGKAEAALATLGLAADDPTRAACLDALAKGGDLAAAAVERFADWVSAAKVLNTEVYVERCTADPRYAKAQNDKPPKKIGSHLTLFDCITCDKCVPVCPNDANFTFDLPVDSIPVERFTYRDGAWQRSEGAGFTTEKKHQLATFHDFCNECGNCDVFCPEDGGPYKMKPRFFGTEADWRLFGTYDGFHLRREGEVEIVMGRFDGQEFTLWAEGDARRFAGEGFAVNVVDGAPTCEAPDEGQVVDLTYFHVMEHLRRSILHTLNYVSTRQDVDARQAE
ncbi:MAG: glutamate synthase [Myxococcales bacterium]|nr:glutamate synthase [Myxococcales bacterium]